MRTRNLSITCALLGLALFVTSSALASIGSNYLPATPYGLNSGGQVQNYGAATSTQFTEPVTCMGTRIGTIDFTYNTWTGTDSSSNPTGGAALAGGFYATCTPMAGYQFGWVQVITADTPGSDNPWGATKTKNFPYPDTSGKSDPDYPNQSLPRMVPNPQPTVAFQDFPNRYVGDGNWNAELGLVCKNLTTHVMDVIETFTWGFSVNAAGDLAITASSPANWSVPTARSTYINVLTNSFDGFDGSQKWTVEVGTCCCTPEPSSLVVWSLAGLIGVAIIRRRKRVA